jgi:hypothetical protein
MPVAENATLRLTRTSNWSGRALNMGVTINDEKVGTLANGESRDFSFVSRGEGNTLVVSAFGYRSGTLTFKARAGQVFNAICATGWVSIEVKAQAGNTLQRGAPLPGMELVTTSVDAKVLKVEVDSEVITVPRGVKRTVKKSRTITRTLEAATTTKAGGEAGVNIGPLTAKIQGEIEKKLGRTFQESEAVEQTVEIDGNTHQRFQLTWYDRMRTGEISYRENGTLKNAKFLFREGTELEVSEL